MVLMLAARRLPLVLALASAVGCSSSSKNAGTQPAVTPGTPSTDPGTGGNGLTGPTVAVDGGTTTTTTPPAVDAGATTPPAPDGGSTTPPADAGVATAPPPAHHRCGWMDDDPTLAKASFLANVDFFDAIHPYWWTLTATGNVTATSWPDDATVVSTAQAHHIKLMPLVFGGNDATMIRAVISSSSSIAAHVQVLVNLAVSHHYDGLELDYEHLWQGSDRPGYTQLVTQLATALHAQGKELSLAVPAIDVDYGIDGYDYNALVAGGADVLHLMGYDFHGDFSDHLGPLAPLGWIDAVNARVQQAGIASRFILGIGNYGIGLGWYRNSADAITDVRRQLCDDDEPHAHLPVRRVHRRPLAALHDVAGRPVVRGQRVDGREGQLGQGARPARRRLLRFLGGEAPGLFSALRSAYP